MHFLFCFCFSIFVLDFVLLFNLFTDFFLGGWVGFEGNYAMPQCSCLLDESCFVSSQAEVCTVTDPFQFHPSFSCNFVSFYLFMCFNFVL